MQVTSSFATFFACVNGLHSHGSVSYPATPFCSLFFLVAPLATQALQITAPTNITTGNATIAFSSEDTDPPGLLTFVLVKNTTRDTIAENVDPTRGHVSVTIPANMTGCASISPHATHSNCAQNRMDNPSLDSRRVSDPPDHTANIVTFSIAVCMSARLPRSPSPRHRSPKAWGVGSSAASWAASSCLLSSYSVSSSTRGGAARSPAAPNLTSKLASPRRGTPKTARSRL
ncbi:hypothetical protein DFH09DRAFT_98209 [Mycena vulgaris]|nr:hypothetical protein DFH09DRAFT_98209 [Mycena vulgaris]